MIKKNNRPILVYRFSSLGDIAMTVPVLRSFFQTYPNQKIVFASRPYAAPLFKEFQKGFKYSKPKLTPKSQFSMVFYLLAVDFAETLGKCYLVCA